MNMNDINIEGEYLQLLFNGVSGGCFRHRSWVRVERGKKRLVLFFSIFFFF